MAPADTTIASDLRTLAELHDPNSRNTYLTVYVDLSHGLYAHFFENRLRACRELLKGDRELVENLEAGYAQAMKGVLGLKGLSEARGAAIFVSPVNDVFLAHSLTVPVKDHLVVDSSPYIRPLAKLSDDWETTALALVDQQTFQLHVISITGADRVASDSEHIMGRHKKGGCSQARFQRLRKGAIKGFLEEAADQIGKMMGKEKIENLVVAGPGIAKKDLIEYLTPRVRQQVIGIFDIHFEASRKELLEQTRSTMRSEERAEELERMAELKGEILTEGLAACGLREVRDMVMSGQVEVLLLSQGLKAGGWKCEPCQHLGLGQREVCRSCHQPVTQVDLIEELVEYAHRTDAEVDFIVDNEELEALGGVAALLRYR